MSREAQAKSVRLSVQGEARAAGDRSEVISKGTAHFRKNVADGEGSAAAGESCLAGRVQDDVQGSLARVERALEVLDLDDRALFLLYEVEGEDSAAIGHAFGLCPETLHTRLLDARRRFLRAHLDLLEAEGF